MDKSCLKKRHADESDRNNPIAIIGMACRFPGANNTTEFWRNLLDGRPLISEVPPNRWRWKAVATGRNQTAVRWGGFIDSPDAFDAAFFGISPREAVRMDPQQRLMLELGWHCLEDAGYAPGSLSGRDIGVFIGCGTHDYHLRQAQSGGAIEGYDPAGMCSSAGISGRLSYFFNFHGPSQTLDVACASSLVAIQQAILSLNAGECSAALVGGVHLMSSPNNVIALDRLRILSASGQARAFDERADGYVRGEGGGVVMLKPLSKALEDNDRPLAVIRGVAVNHNGRARSVTAPNAFSQARVITAAYKKSGLTPFDVSYIEANGTGSPLGDGIEAAGLIRTFRAFKKERPKTTEPFCAIGSVKNQIGHLEAGAGIASLIKTVLALKHRYLPATQNFDRLNPRVNLENAPFFVLRQGRDWEPLRTEEGTPLPLRAGISAFGLSGVNCHLVLEEAPVPAKKTSAVSNSHFLLALSAASAASLQRMARQYLSVLNQSPQQAGVICARANCSRAQLPVRWACLARQSDELITALQDLADNPVQPNSDLHLSFATNADDNTNDNARALQNAGVLFCRGEKVDWHSLYADLPPLVNDLPLYPFERTSYWLEASPNKNTKVGRTDSSWTELNLENCRLVCMDNSLPQSAVDYFLDHQLSGHSILPAAGYLHLVLTAIARSEQLSGPRSLALDQIEFHHILNLSQSSRLTTLLKQNDNNEEWSFRILAQPNLTDEAECYASGTIRKHEQGSVDVPSLPEKQNTLEALEFYQLCASAGWQYGARFQAITRLHHDTEHCWAEVSLPASLEPTEAGTVHPVLLDAALQSLAPLIADQASNHLPLPVSLERFRLLSSDTQPAHLLCSLVSASHHGARANIVLLDHHHRPVAELTGLTLQFLPADRLGVLLAQSAVSPAAKKPPSACLPVGTLIALSPQEAKLQLLEGLRQLLSEILGESVQDCLAGAKGEQRHLTALGMDSLSGLEFKRQLKAWLKIDLSAEQLLGGATLAELVTVIQQKLLLKELTDPKPNSDATAEMEVFDL